MRAYRGWVAMICIAIGGTVAYRYARQESAPVELSEQEIAELRRDLAARMAAERTMTCSRPVLRGQALRGSTHEALVDVYELRGKLAGCKKHVMASGEKHDPIKDALWSCKEVSSDTGPDPAPSLRLSCRRGSILGDRAAGPAGSTGMRWRQRP